MNNKTITIIIPHVSNFRKIYESKDGLGAMYGATCSVLDLFSVRQQLDEVLDINPRNQKGSSVPSRAMRETLRDAQEMFVFRNRGLTFISYDAVWDNKTYELKLTFKIGPTVESTVNGLADGGHTYEVIKNFIAEIEEAERGSLTANVRLDILTGFEGKPDEVGAIVEARNTSTQVRNETLLNSRGVFNQLKEVLGGYPYAQNIAYYENELIDEKNQETGYRSIKVASILSYLMCFDISSFTENGHPIVAYSSKKKPLEWYEHKWETDKHDLAEFLKLAPQILELRDYIESQVPKVWNKLSARYADQKGVNKLRSSRELDFSDYLVDFDVPGGHIYPILAAFRSLIVKERGVYKFRTEPKAFFDEMNYDSEGERSLIHKLRGAQDQDPQAMGKNSSLYDSCYGSLRGYYYEQLSKN